MKKYSWLVIVLLIQCSISFAQNGYIQQNFQLPFSNESKPYFVKLVGTDYVLNGDIIVGTTLQKTMLYQNNDKDRYIWPKGEIGIKLDESLATHATLINNQNLKQLALEAIQIFNQQTNLRLAGYHGQKDYINIKFSKDTTYGGMSPVGRVGGEQIIWITDRASLAALLHEMMHSFGFWHEQSRYDRDQFIEIDIDKVDPVFKHNFQMEPGTPVSAYDYSSVMHYHKRAFAINPKDITIKCKKNNRVEDCDLGNNYLSSKDIEGINASYFYNAQLPRVTYRELYAQQPNGDFQNAISNGSRFSNIGLSPIKTGYYKIKVNQTGKYLAIEGISMNNGARLVQWDFVDQGNHKFFVQELGGGYYQISALHSNKYINAAGQSKANGTAIIQWDWANQDNVKWTIGYAKTNEGSQAGWVIQNKNSNSPLRLQSMYSNNNGEAFIIQQPAYADGGYEPVQTFTFERLPDQQLNVPKQEKLADRRSGVVNQIR